VQTKYRTFIAFIICAFLLFIGILTYAFTEKINTLKTEAGIQSTYITELETELDKYKTIIALPNIKIQIHQLQPKLDPQLVDQIGSAIKRNCKQYHLPPNLIMSLIYRESSFDLFATSNKKCYGLMQVQYKSHEKLLKKLGINTIYKLYHVDNNIDAGCAILSQMLIKEKTVTGALKRYVGGVHKTYIPDIFRTMAEYTVPIGAFDKTSKGEKRNHGKPIQTHPSKR